MEGNGASAYAHLEGRVAELEAALSILTRHYRTELVPRVLAVEEEVGGQREALTDLATHVRALADEDDTDRGRRR